MKRKNKAKIRGGHDNASALIEKQKQVVNG